MRDRLIHGYFGVDYQIVWDVVQNKIPDLLGQIEAILAQSEGPGALPPGVSERKATPSGLVQAEIHVSERSCRRTPG